MMFSENTNETVTCHCRTQLLQKAFCYTWSIEDFLEICNCKTKIKSSNFGEIYSDNDKIYSDNDEIYFDNENINETRFQLSIENDNLKFYIIIDKSCSKITGSYSIFLNTNERDIICVSKSTFKLHDEELLYELPISSIPTYLFNGTFTIHFKFDIFHDLLQRIIYYSTNDFTERPADSRKSYSNAKTLDNLVTLVIYDKSLQLNKNLLYLNCEFFERILGHDFKKENKIQVKATDISYDFMKEILFFLKIDHLSEKIKTDAKTLCELLLIAYKYDIGIYERKLQFVCEEYLIINTTIKNVIEHLKITYSIHGSNTLKIYAIKFINLYLKEIKNTPEFKILVQNDSEILSQIQKYSNTVIQLT